ncbi:protein bric-a-brac 1 isoform X4 [Hyalella azteca]|uniref:Protein bric-a-brac 1 isoform X4 n=1 Tax=Hyalella azteca TaxID=294128 RepID=A0A8B7MYG3_HYAAZ|nr:protein bric-a-brac 1 isoform X4 [Hyalella azteca]
MFNKEGRKSAGGRSKIWLLSHFVDETRTMVQCSLCPVQIKYVGNTTNVARHLEVKHPEQYNAVSQLVPSNRMLCISHSRSSEEQIKQQKEENAIKRILYQHKIEKLKTEMKSDSNVAAILSHVKQELNSDTDTQNGLVVSASNDTSWQSSASWSWHTPISKDGVVGQRSMLQDDNGELSSGGGSVGLSGIEAVVAAAAAAAAAAGDPGPAVSGASQTSTDNHMMMGGGAMTSSISSSAAAREAAIGMSPPSVTSPNKPESYQLRHNNHLSLVLNQLAEDEAFMDVTLTAEGRSVKAHKSVLSAVSPYFSAVLRANPCQHPIIIMPRDVRYAELSNIIMYIYKGEMTVSAEDLPSLLKTAELLRITGLSPGENATSSQQPLTRTTNLSSSSSTVTANSFAGLFNGSMNPTSTSYSTPPHSESSRVLGSPRHEHLLQTTPIKKSSGSCLAKATPVRIESPTPDPTMLNPSDFMDLDMTCVKEELNSEEEDEEDIPKSPSPKEVTTPPPVENPLSSDSRDRHPPDARLDQEDPDTQPNLEAASDDHDSSHLRQSSHQSSSSPAGQREDSDNEIKRSSLKTLANLASLDTPTNLSPCDDSSSSSSSSLPDTSEILPNVCPYCSEYVVGNDMSSHLSTKHAFKPAFICSECQRVFTRKNVREMHAKDCKKET